MAKEYTRSDIEEMLGRAERERVKLAKTRDSLNAQIAELDRLIDSMRSIISPPLPTESPIVGEFAVALLKHVGLTDVVRMTLQASAHQGYITITQIIDKLKSVSYPLNRLDNPRAAIVVVLSRMVSAGDVEKKDTGRPEPAFRWIDQTEEPFHKRLAKQFMEARTK